MFCVPKNSVEGCQHFCCVRCFKPATCLYIHKAERLRNISSHWGHVDLPFPFLDYWIVDCSAFSSRVEVSFIGYKRHAHAGLQEVAGWVIPGSSQWLHIKYYYIGWAGRQNFDKLSELSVKHTYIHIAGRQPAHRRDQNQIAGLAREYDYMGRSLMFF